MALFGGGCSGRCLAAWHRTCHRSGPSTPDSSRLAECAARSVGSGRDNQCPRSKVVLSSEVHPGEQKIWLSFDLNPAVNPFVTQFRFSPGEHHLRLQGPLAAVNVSTEDSVLTYLRLSPIKTNDEAGVSATITSGKPTPELLDKLEELRKNFRHIYVSTPAPTSFTLSTEPPWPIPPPPKR
jgi:hypothetical protein